jgi:hypothetical protein
MPAAWGPELFGDQRAVDYATARPGKKTLYGRRWASNQHLDSGGRPRSACNAHRGPNTWYNAAHELQDAGSDCPAGKPVDDPRTLRPSIAGLLQFRQDDLAFTPCSGEHESVVSYQDGVGSGHAHPAAHVQKPASRRLAPARRPSWNDLDREALQHGRDSFRRPKGSPRTAVSDAVRVACLELGRSELETRHWVAALDAEHLFDLYQLEALSPEGWASLQLPMGLQVELQRRISDAAVRGTWQHRANLSMAFPRRARRASVPPGRHPALARRHD